MLNVEKVIKEKVYSKPFQLGHLSPLWLLFIFIASPRFSLYHLLIQGSPSITYLWFLISQQEYIINDRFYLF